MRLRLTAALMILAATPAFAQTLATFDQVPFYYTQSPQLFQSLWQSAQTQTVRIAIFGDSQETNPGGMGLDYIPLLSYGMWQVFGNEPETRLEGCSYFGGGSPYADWLASGGCASPGPAPSRLASDQILPGMQPGAYSTWDGSNINDNEQFGQITLLQQNAVGVDPAAGIPTTNSYFNTNGTVVAQIFAATNPASGDIAWRAQPTDSALPSYYASITDQGTLSPGLTSTTFAIVSATTDPLPYDGNTYMAVQVAGTDDGELTDILGLRFVNQSYPQGVVFDTFSAGGYATESFLNNNGYAGPIFQALGFSAVIFHYGADDVSFGDTAAEFMTHQQELISLVRTWLGNPSFPVILIADVWRDGLNAAQQAQYDMYVGAQLAIAQADPNVLVINSRRLMDDVGWNGTSGQSATFLQDLVHYTPLGAQTLAAAEVGALMDEIIVASCLSDSGSVALGSTDTLVVDVGGASACSGYGQLAAPDLALGQATLTVQLTGGFAPAAGQTFQILSSGSISGTFGTLDLPPLANGLAWDTSALYTGGVLGVDAVQGSSITFNPLPDEPLGSGPYALSASASSGLPVAFSSLTPSVCAVSSNTVTLLATGMCTIAANQSGDAEFQAAPQVTQSFNVLGEAQSITFAPLAGTALAASPLAVNATASSGLAILFSSQTPGVCTVTGTQVTLLTLGTCTIAADQSGNAIYAAAPEVTQSFNVLENQSVNFAPLANQYVGAGAIVLAASDSSGLPLSYSSLTPQVCTISGTTLILQGAGTCTVAANQAGNQTYGAATVTQSFTVYGAGTIVTMAGNGIAGNAGDGGLATAASLTSPTGLSFDAAGDLDLADVGTDTARQVSTAGLIATIAGSGSAGFAGDGGPASAALLNGPTGLALDALGNLYIADSANHRIRMITPGGVISTVAGNGTAGYSGDGGLATAAELNTPHGLAFDAAGNLYIADTANNVIREVAPQGLITTIAGTGVPGYGGDGGSALQAQLDLPWGIAFDATGSLWLADAGNNVIRSIDTTGLIATGVGTGVAGFAGDGLAPAAAQLAAPHWVAFDAAGNLYISDGGNQRVRMLSGGLMSTLAGTGNALYAGDGGPASQASLASPEGLALDGSGNLYVADSGDARIREIYGVGPAKSAQTIGFPTIGTQTLGSGPVTLAATASSGLPVIFSSQTTSVCAVTGSALTLLATGICTIAADQAGNASYAAAPEVTQSFAVSAPALLSQTINFAPIGGQTLGAAPLSVPASATSGLPVNITSLTSATCSVSGSTISLLAVGICTVVAAQPGDATYAPAPSVTQMFSIASAIGDTPQSISFPAITDEALGTSPISVAVSDSSGLPVTLTSQTPTTCSVSGTTITLLAIGVCTLVASQAGDATYAAANTVSESFNVTSASTTISAPLPPWTALLLAAALLARAARSRTRRAPRVM